MMSDNVRIVSCVDDFEGYFIASLYAFAETFVDGRRLYLADGFPHKASAERERCRLPECQAVAACRVKIQASVIGMCEEIGG